MSKEICGLQVERDIRETQLIRMISFTNKVTVNLYVLGLFVEDRVSNNVKGNLTITKQLQSLIVEDSQGCKKGFLSHTNSLVATAIDRYSTFANDLETVVCFLIFKKTGEPPRVTNYLVKECLGSRQATQPGSQ